MVHLNKYFSIIWSKIRIRFQLYNIWTGQYRENEDKCLLGEGGGEDDRGKVRDV